MIKTILDTLDSPPPNSKASHSIPSYVYETTWEWLWPLVMGHVIYYV